MPTSQKQIDANKRNAQLSTGARSPEGKSKTRLNALRDGFTGQVTTLSDEDRPIFEKFKAEFIADLAPKTTLELSLAHSIAWDTWRLNHLRAVEMNMYAMGAAQIPATGDDANPQTQTAFAAVITFGDESAKLALMSIYEQRMNRSLHKNLDKLHRLQAERRTAQKRDRDEEVVIARFSDIKGLTYQAPTTPTPNGCVFSNQEIFTAAHRKSTLDIARATVKHAPFKVQFAAAASNASTNLRHWPEPDAA